MRGALLGIYSTAESAVISAKLYFPTAGQNLLAKHTVQQQRNYLSLLGNIIMLAIHSAALLYSDPWNNVILNSACVL